MLEVLVCYMISVMCMCVACVFVVDVIWFSDYTEVVFMGVVDV